jgi:hypothetical protein
MSQTALAAPTFSFSDYITPALATIPGSDISVANVSDILTSLDKRQLDPIQLKRVAFLAQRLNANPKPITDFSTPCNGEWRYFCFCPLVLIY